MNYRQVHLDFHNSDKIPAIGDKFDKRQFQDALKEGHVNSITVFAKCAFGWLYYPSKVGEMHPNLKFDLLKAEIEAAHEIGVKTPVYISATLGVKDTRIHPEWLVRNKDESTSWVRNFTEPGYMKFCLNSPHLELLLKIVDEVCENYDADGIFMDIASVTPCYCQNCVRTLLKENKDPYDEKNALMLAERVYKNYVTKIRETIDKHKKGLPVFHNGGHLIRGRRDIAFGNSHLELESLPTGGWGYDHFPLSAAYARTLNFEFLGMTGKFHESWGEFGGFKHPNALKYEAALAAANGAKMSVGDQLHPNGKMDMATYNLIGKAYSQLEKIEPWLENAQNIVDIGVLSVEAVKNYYRNNGLDLFYEIKNDISDVGCVRVLLEGKFLFNFIDADADFNEYKLIILPDIIKVDKFLYKKIKSYLQNKGKMFVTGKSGFWIDKEKFAFDEPKKNIVYNQYNIFEEYALNGDILIRNQAVEMINKLLGNDKTLTVDLPSSGLTTLTKQNDRYINHLLYVSPVLRGDNIEIIEDILPVKNINVTFKIDKKVKRVYKAPQMTQIDFNYENGLLKYTVDYIECSQLVVIE